MEFLQKRGSISDRLLSFGANILQIKSQVLNRIANSFEKHVLNCNLVSLKEARNPFFFKVVPVGFNVKKMGLNLENKLPKSASKIKINLS